MTKDRKERTDADPMREENFPDNPTRRAADKHMMEPTNAPGSNPDVAKRGRRITDSDDEDTS